MDIPQKFIDLYGQEMTYSDGDRDICKGTVIEARFSRSMYINMKTFEQWYGVELKIKPNDGFNRNRAIWTMAFDSGIKIPDDE